MIPNYKVKFEKEVIPVLMKELNTENKWSLPRFTKIVVNMGIGEAIQNYKLLEAGVAELAAVTGQKPIITKAKKSIAAFKLRTGHSIGCCVTLRDSKMYEFYERLVNIVLPRVRDFRGLSRKSFDGHGNYTLALKDQLVFPEIHYAKVEKAKGMNITIVTTAGTDHEAFKLLSLMDMPFRRQ